MSVQFERATVTCEVCSAEVSELRRGRCWGCYVRWTETRPVGLGASCQICSEKRRHNLRVVELHSKSVPLCHNCAARTIQLSPVPETIEDIRMALLRNRRQDERRSDSFDHRLFPRERRVDDRRHAGGERKDDTQPNYFLSALDDLVIELSENDIEVVEQTQVRETPQRPRHA